ncbi:heavy metal translocating P-type ATPase [Guggenheimella bovis]
MKERIVTIEGMSCSACSQAVEKALLRVEGVKEAEVNNVTKQGRIFYDETKVALEDFRGAIAKAGYELVDEPEEVEEEGIDKTLYWLVGLTFLLLIFSMGPMLGLTLPRFITPKINATIQLLLALTVMVIGKEFYQRGIKSLLLKSPNMDTLIAVGTSAAFLFSLYHTFLIFSGHDHYVHELYFETAATIITLIKVGKTLEEHSKRKTTDAVKKLIGLRPKNAILIEGDETREVPTGMIHENDIILVTPGMNIPLDGIIVSGKSTVDESMLTGESELLEKAEEDSVFSGTLNISNALTIRVTKVQTESLLNQIIELVERAQLKKAPIARFADKVSGVFVPAVMLIALISFIVWFFVSKDLNFSIRIFVAVLVIACPCALGLATPTAIMVASGTAAKNGILMKSGEALEKAHQITSVVFDKTGTLTEGKPEVVEWKNLSDLPDERILDLVSSLERFSEHPYATAILDLHKKSLSVVNFKSHAGLGVEGDIEGLHLLAGNRKLLGIEDETSEVGIYFSIDGVLAATFVLKDALKSTSKEAVATLKTMGIKPIMLTGDRESIAKEIAKKVGVEEFYASVTPEEKSEIIKRIQEKGEVVSMVGDGINDSVALVTSDVGIAMGTGTDIAMESADVVLVHGDLLRVASTIELSRKTIRNIKENLFWAFIYNIIGIPFAAGILYAFGGPLLNPMIAALAMSLSSVSVVMNALRLSRVKL